MSLLSEVAVTRGSLLDGARLLLDSLGQSNLAGAQRYSSLDSDGYSNIGLFQAAGGYAFRTQYEDGFRIGQDGPQFQNTGTNDTVPGSPNVMFSVAIGGSVNGRTNTAGDDDYYAVELVAGQSYVFTLTGRGGDPLLDPYLELRNSEGALLGFNDDSGPGYSSTLRWTATVSGTYYLNARAYEPANPPYTTGDYTLSAAIGTAQDPLDTIDYNWTVPTTTIEVYFATGGQSFFGETAVRSWTQAEINAAMAALATYSAVAPLTFTQTFTQANAEFTLMLHNMDAGVLGYFSPTQGFGAFSPSTTSWQAVGSLNPGGSAFATLVHEFGHALGLAHPHDEGGVRDGNGDGSSEVMQGVTSPFGVLGTFQLNQGVFTTMSYNDGWQQAPWGATNSLAFGSQATPMALDVAIIQQRYGVNTTYNNGNNTYTLTGVNGSFIAIWDTGGTDTISYTGTAAATIDLRPATIRNEVGGGGYVSYVNNVYQGFTIANGVVIENATGSAGADTLIGNDANNRLTGAANNDAIHGMGGIDTSVYTVASTGATWTRSVNGNWTVNAGANGIDTLTSVERLEFTDRTVVLDNAQRTFSGNGTSDFLFRNANNGTVVIWEVTGAAQNSAAVAGGAPAEWTLVGTGDLNGDGRDDMIWRHDGGGVAGWLMNGSTATAVAMVGGAPNEWQIAGIGDFNFDGKDDFIWRNTNDGSVAVWLMNGLTSTSQAIISGAPTSWAITAIADFDGDGRDDILLRNTDGTLARWTTDGVTQTGAAIVGYIPTEWAFEGAGDFDGDGRADLIWRNDTGGIAMWRMDGDTQLGAQMIGAAPSDWNLAGVGDYNGDGKDDLLWQHTDGTIALWTMNGFTITNQSIVSVVPNEWVLVG